MPTPGYQGSVCETCMHHKLIESASGSRFLMCQKSKQDERFAKYPPQPLVRCIGYREEPDPAQPRER